MTLLVSDVCGVAFDAIHANVHNIPLDAFAVGGYINGANTSFIWTQQDWARFPHAYQIRINVTGELGRGNALDVESLDATPANIQPWIESVHTSPDPLLIYCNRSNLQDCLNARNAAHKATGRFVFMWEATLDGTMSNRAMTQIFQGRVNGTAVMDISLIQDIRLRTQMAARIGKQ